MSLYRKKPVVIEARRLTNRDHEGLARWCGGELVIPDDGLPYIIIPTLEGDHRANFGDWIIQGVQGEYYPCKPDIFTETYEEVVETEECWYCGSEGSWTKQHPVYDDNREARVRVGLQPLEEPIVLCDLCYSSAVGLTGAILGFERSTQEIERVVARYLNSLVTILAGEGTTDE